MSAKKNVFTLSKILDKIKNLVLDLDSTKQEIELLNSKKQKIGAFFYGARNSTSVIECGFKPTRILIHSNISDMVTVEYINGFVYRNGGTNDESSSIIFDIMDNGFSFKQNGSNNWVNTAMIYFAES